MIIGQWTKMNHEKWNLNDSIKTTFCNILGILLKTKKSLATQLDILLLFILLNVNLLGGRNKENGEKNTKRVI